LSCGVYLPVVLDYHRKPSEIQQKLQNCDLAIRLLKKLDIPMSNNVRPKGTPGHSIVCSSFCFEFENANFVLS
jgi:hypothetical protein